MTSFDDKVYMVCRLIPKGKVSTYKDLAHAIGSKAYRAVGNALNRNPFAPEVPCHRVINSDGYVGGFASKTSNKEALLKKEGIVITDGRIDLQKFKYVGANISTDEKI